MQALIGRHIVYHGKTAGRRQLIAALKMILDLDSEGAGDAKGHDAALSLVRMSHQNEKKKSVVDQKRKSVRWSDGGAV